MNDALIALAVYWSLVGGLAAVAYYCLKWPK